MYLDDLMITKQVILAVAGRIFSVLFRCFFGVIASFLKIHIITFSFFTYMEIYHIRFIIKIQKHGNQSILKVLLHF